MKSIALMISMFLLSTNVFAEKFSALVQCQFEGPIHEAVFVLPTNISDWTCKDVNAGKAEFVTSVAPTIEINGMVYTGATSYPRDVRCEYMKDWFLPSELKFKSPTGLEIELDVEGAESESSKITYVNHFYGSGPDLCYWVRK